MFKFSPSTFTVNFESFAIIPDSVLVGSIAVILVKTALFSEIFAVFKFNPIANITTKTATTDVSFI